MKEKITAIVGPTAVGKTQAAIHMAKELNAEIVCVDSLLVYKEFNIGTAKPTLKEQQGIPHHLIDIVDPTAFFTAGDFKRAAQKVIDEIHARGKKVLLVGGSGLYLKALTQGMFKAPPSDETVRKELAVRIELEGRRKLYQELSKIDPETATRIHPNNGYRILRALEVFYTCGKKFSEFRQNHKPECKWDIEKIGINCDRAELHKRIQVRTEKMFDLGLIDEVKQLKEKYPSDCKPFKSIGYKEALLYLDNKLSKSEMIEKMAQQTRALARRQLTWFRGDKEVKWVAIEI